MSERKRTNIVMPVVATLASAVASYLAKKGPQYLEQTLLPKVRETKAQASDIGQPSRDEVSNDDLERRRRDRAEHRAARRKAS
jgi:hypothetical protein